MLLTTARQYTSSPCFKNEKKKWLLGISFRYIIKSEKLSAEAKVQRLEIKHYLSGYDNYWIVDSEMASTFHP